MKKEERIALSYLNSCGYIDIEHEPDGNIPPDFALNKKIGIEVCSHKIVHGAQFYVHFYLFLFTKSFPAILTAEK